MFTKLSLLSFFAFFLVSACRPTPQGNVIAYQLSKRLNNHTPSPSTIPPGTLTGQVMVDGTPTAGITVLVAERHGKPYSAQSNADGYYRIEGIPAGQYVPAAVGVGLEETMPSSGLGVPRLVTIRSAETTTTAVIHLQPHVASALPQPLAPGVQLSITAQYTAATNFPPSSEADVTAFQFTVAGATVDTLRLYLPRPVKGEQLEAKARLPMLLMVYPSPVDRWISVSTAYAAQGYALVAISPVAARLLDVDAHAQDARVALELGRSGALDEHIDGTKVVALGGSFSSAILHRLLRDVNLPTSQGEESAIQGWVTVGGVADAFSGTADFYAGRLQIPPEYELLIPALGQAHLAPLSFLRYSPVYTAGQLPKTLIIHTDADLVIPIQQAYDLEAALRSANVATTVFYYNDVSHYLQIGEDMTDAGAEMFWRVLEFVEEVNNE